MRNYDVNHNEANDLVKHEIEMIRIVHKKDKKVWHGYNFTNQLQPHHDSIAASATTGLLQ